MKKNNIIMLSLGIGIGISFQIYRMLKKSQEICTIAKKSSDYINNAKIQLVMASKSPNTIANLKKEFETIWQPRFKKQNINSLKILFNQTLKNFNIELKEIKDKKFINKNQIIDIDILSPWKPKFDDIFNTQEWEITISSNLEQNDLFTKLNYWQKNILVQNNPTQIIIFNENEIKNLSKNMYIINIKNFYFKNLTLPKRNIYKTDIDNLIITFANIPIYYPNFLTPRNCINEQLKIIETEYEAVNKSIYTIEQLDAKLWYLNIKNLLPNNDKNN